MDLTKNKTINVLFQLVGRATTVKKVMGTKAILEGGGQRWSFNIKSLLVLAKNSKSIKKSLDENKILISTN